MEKQLFDWSGWDEISVNVMQFHDCIMKVNIGPYKVGQAVPVIEMDYEKSFIRFYADADVFPATHEYPLVLSVVVEN